jgi:hypothetical protein
MTEPALDRFEMLHRIYRVIDMIDARVASFEAARNALIRAGKQLFMPQAPEACTVPEWLDLTADCLRFADTPGTDGRTLPKFPEQPPAISQ